jgi:hypothetical protein
MGKISDCLQHKGNLKEIIYLLYILTKKIRNGLNGIIRGLGETDPCKKKSEVEHLVALSL